jgi:hypothetical protein
MKRYTTPFTQNIKSPHARIIAALVNTDLNVDATNAIEIFEAGTSDSKIAAIDLMSVAASIAGRVILYKYDGATYEPLRDVLVYAITPDNVQFAWSGTIQFNDFGLEVGMKLFIGATAISSAIAVHVHAGDYEEVI